MKTWEDFYDDYLADLPGCTYFHAEKVLRRAAQEFCRRSHCWRVTLDPVTLVGGVADYEFDFDANQEVVKLVSAKLDGQDFPVLADDAAGYVGARGVVLRNQREFSVLPVPADGQQLVMRAILRPADRAAGVEDFIFAAHAEQIGYGARYRLLETPGTPYYNPAAAASCRDRFEQAISDVKIQSAKAYSSAPLRTSPSFM